MGDFLSSAYPWLKAFHLIAVIAWMAGLLHLARLYVYHAEAEPGGSEAAKLVGRELQTLRIIVNPTMIAAWGLGLALSFTPGLFAWSSGWFHAKFALILAISAYHGFLARLRREFAAGTINRSPRFYRILNEVPFVLMLFVVILVIVKPF
jgi:putative membrane protein